MSEPDPLIRQLREQISDNDRADRRGDQHAPRDSSRG